MSGDLLLSLRALQSAAHDARALAQQALDSCDEVMDGIRDLIRANTPTPAPTASPVPMPTESYWQRGFNDGVALREPDPPTAPLHVGYFNGYRAGKAKRGAS